MHVATHDLLAIESLLACPSLELDCEFISGALTGSLAWHISDKSSLMKNELSTVSPVSVVGKTSHVWGKYSSWWWENRSHSRKIRLQKCPASGTPVGYCLPELLRLAWSFLGLSPTSWDGEEAGSFHDEALCLESTLGTCGLCFHVAAQGDRPPYGRAMDHNCLEQREARGGCF